MVVNYTTFIHDNTISKNQKINHRDTVQPLKMHPSHTVYLSSKTDNQLSEFDNNKPK